MKRYYWLMLYIVSLALTTYVCWPLLAPYAGEVKSVLASFKAYCQESPVTSYAIYIGGLACTLLLGLPFSSLFMLLGGITYDFWEATFMITLCRLTVALIAFQLARTLLFQDRKPKLPRQLKDHPLVALLLMRLAPIPDSAVNYSVASFSIRRGHYALISLVGMVPMTMAFVMAGHELGNITNLVSSFL